MLHFLYALIFCCAALPPMDKNSFKTAEGII